VYQVSGSCTKVMSKKEMKKVKKLKVGTEGGEVEEEGGDVNELRCNSSFPPGNIDIIKT
jgi:hypothetical protein